MNFEGFVPPTKNYFPMPNEWIDICADIRDISELKVIQYVIRHTWGFHEFGICKTISVDEFMQGRRRQDGTRMDKGTGLSEQSVRNGLKKAIKDGYLLCETDPSDAGRIKKSYALKMLSDGQVQTLDPPQSLDPVPGTNFIPQGTKPYTSDSQSLDPRVPEFIPRTEKDTIERHLEKNTLEKQESMPASLTEYKQRKETDPKLVAITQEMLAEKVIAPALKLPSKQKPAASADGEAVVQPPHSQVSHSPDVAPPASVGGTAQAGAGAELPAMALTAKQIEKQNERRAKEIWAVVERELKTKFSATQRKSDNNTKGMENLLEDQVSDSTLETALKAMPLFYIQQFNLKKFHELLPGLTSTRDAPPQDGKAPAPTNVTTLYRNKSDELRAQREKYAAQGGY